MRSTTACAVSTPLTGASPHLRPCCDGYRRIAFVLSLACATGRITSPIPPATAVRKPLSLFCDVSVCFQFAAASFLGSDFIITLLRPASLALYGGAPPVPSQSINRSSGLMSPIIQTRDSSRQITLVALRVMPAKRAGAICGDRAGSCRWPAAIIAVAAQHTLWHSPAHSPGRAFRGQHHSRHSATAEEHWPRGAVADDQG